MHVLTLDRNSYIIYTHRRPWTISLDPSALIEFDIDTQTGILVPTRVTASYCAWAELDTQIYMQRRVPSVHSSSALRASVERSRTT